MANLPYYMDPARYKAAGAMTNDEYERAVAANPPATVINTAIGALPAPSGQMPQMSGPQMMVNPAGLNNGQMLPNAPQGFQFPNFGVPFPYQNLLAQLAASMQSPTGQGQYQRFGASQAQMPPFWNMPQLPAGNMPQLPPQPFGLGGLLGNTPFTSPGTNNPLPATGNPPGIIDASQVPDNTVPVWWKRAGIDPTTLPSVRSFLKPPSPEAIAAYQATFGPRR